MTPRASHGHTTWHSVSAVEGGRYTHSLAGDPVYFLVAVRNLCRHDTYLIDLATFAVSLVAVGLMRPHPPTGGGTPVSWAGFWEGLGFLRCAPIL